MNLLITDLDNTLYDWVTYFSRSFGAMVAHLSEFLDVPVDQLLDEFKLVHQKHRNSEHPFALFEIESVRKRFCHYSPSELKVELDGALHEFNRQRRATLSLYPGVAETLRELELQGVTIVAHTEAIAENAYFRLKFFEIVDVFKHLYAIDAKISLHPSPGRELELSPPEGFLQLVPVDERKPNPRLLLDICERERVHPKDTVYVGDSLIRDMSMAKSAGIKAVWARYGTNYDRQLWEMLVRVTHWTPEDVRREEDLRREYANVNPDVSIDSFSDLLKL